MLELSILSSKQAWILLIISSYVLEIIKFLKDFFFVFYILKYGLSLSILEVCLAV